ncbi:polyprenyl synthetase family protein [Coraliomargarita parva]|uniref:polyprenyl synthetase family protein n=1 Tax=Coraliomargarita parva TaxID=3014050 RepID=UPI0022B39304|nr:polyprenyl synthetase family protein [Coraliomargarita parva]
MEAALDTNHFSSAPELRTVPYSLSESIAYALESKGSGLRQAMARDVAAACGLQTRDADLLAEGIEYFHHASLIFDDLPCMDDADERRGRLCLHRVAGEDRAVLAALALVNRAYTLCWKVSTRYSAYSHYAGRVVERSMGELGILEGQARDLSYHPVRGAAEVKAIAGRKTGALLELTLLLPTVLAGASFRTILRLARLARYWGIIYQGMDDFSDLLLGPGNSGKTAFRDLQQARPNLVLALGKQKAYAELNRYLERAKQQIERLVVEDTKWSFLSDYHARFGGKAAALKSAVEAA